MMELGGEVYRSVLESLPVGVYLVGQDRRIVLWNNGAERLTATSARRWWDAAARKAC